MTTVIFSRSILIAMMLCVSSQLLASSERERKVFIFVIDGVTKNALFNQMDNGNAVAINEVKQQGIFRTGHVSASNNIGENSYPSVSGLGWRTITGFTINHGVTENTFEGSRMDRPNFFSLAKMQRQEFTGLAAVTWAPVIEKIFKPFDEKGDFTLESFRHLDRPEGDFIGDRAAANFVLNQMSDKKTLPDISFVGFNETDEFGHLGGFSTKNPAYLRAIDLLSNLSGKIINRAETLYPEYDKLYIFTTDHAGRLNDRKHSIPSTEYTRRVWTAAHSPNFTIDNVPKVFNAEDISALAFKFLRLEFPHYYAGKIGDVSFRAKRGPRTCMKIIEKFL